jgi:hypothetical protein
MAKPARKALTRKGKGEIFQSQGQLGEEWLAAQAAHTH